MKDIEQIDISGDAGLRIRGESLEKVFENAARGLFSLITNISEITETEKREVVLPVDNYENALVQWLNELVFLFDTYGFTGKVFNVTFKDHMLKAVLTGCAFDPERSEKKLLIKAATYHNLSLNKINSGWEATVIFDI